MENLLRDKIFTDLEKLPKKPIEPKVISSDRRQFQELDFSKDSKKENLDITATNNSIS